MHQRCGRRIVNVGIDDSGIIKWLVCSELYHTFFKIPEGSRLPVKLNFFRLNLDAEYLAAHPLVGGAIFPCPPPIKLHTTRWQQLAGEIQPAIAAALIFRAFALVLVKRYLAIA